MLVFVQKITFILRKMHKNCYHQSCSLAQICTKSFVGFAPDPTEGAYSAPPDPLAVFRGPTSQGRGGGEEGRREKGRERGSSSFALGRKRKVGASGCKLRPPWSASRIFGPQMTTGGHDFHQWRTNRPAGPTYASPYMGPVLRV